jgi:hypothetical protein
MCISEGDLVMMRRALCAAAVAAASLVPLSASAVSLAPTAAPVGYARLGCPSGYYCNWEYYNIPAYMPPVVGYTTRLCNGMIMSGGHGTPYYIFTESKCTG